MFFVPWENPRDGQTYFKYNERYFEINRPQKDWNRSPDLFSEQTTPEVQPYLDQILGQKSEATTKGKKIEKIEEEEKKEAE